MDIRFLESLIAVIETGSIAAAARRENLTAPAISQRIQALEKTLSCELLNRTAHSVEPSEQCQRLLPRIRQLIQSAAELKEEVDVNSLAGHLRLGAVSTALTGLLPDIMHGLTTQAPQLRLRITPGDSRTLYEQVLCGELDAGLMVAPPFSVPKSVRMQTLRKEPLMFLTKTPVQSADIVSTLMQQPFIRYDSNAWGGQIAQQYLNDNDLSPEVFCNLDALDAISIMVAKGMGVSLVPAWAGLKTDNLYAVPVPTANDYIRQIVLLHKASPRRPKALKLIEQLLISHCTYA